LLVKGWQWRCSLAKESLSDNENDSEKVDMIHSVNEISSGHANSNNKITNGI
jgi:hypothetical protein